MPHDAAPALLRAVEGRARDEAAQAEGRLLALRIKLTGATAMHAKLAADPAHWRLEVEAAAQRASENIALERLLIETRPIAAPVISVAGRDFDFAALLDECLDDKDLREAALAALASIEARIPAGAPALSAEIDALLAEARDLALNRAQDGEGAAR